MKNYKKIITILIIGYFYFFANGLLTKLIYPLECKELIPWIHFNGQNYNLIDLNLPHLFAFILIGALFKWRGLLFAILGELAQSVIKHQAVSFMDIDLNIIGVGIGILSTHFKITRR